MPRRPEPRDVSRPVPVMIRRVRLLTLDLFFFSGVIVSLPFLWLARLLDRGRRGADGRGPAS